MKDSQTTLVAVLVAALALTGTFGSLHAQKVVLPPGEPAIDVAPPAGNETEAAAEEASGDAAATTADAVPATAVGGEAEGGEGELEGAAISGAVGGVIETTPAPPAAGAATGRERPAGPVPAGMRMRRGETPPPGTGVPGAESDEMEDEEEEEALDLPPLPERPINKEEDAFLPASYALQRYEPTWSNSAFTREIVAPVGTIEEKPPSELSKYALAGIATIGGAPLVSAFTAKNEPITIRSAPKKAGDVFVVSVDRKEKMSDSSVTISDGKETAEIKFDAKRLAAPPKGALAMATGNPAAGRGQVPAGAVGGGNLTPQQQQAVARQQQLQAQQAQAQQAQAAQQNLTPQQQQEQAAAQQQASAQLIEHLKAAAAQPAAATPQPGGGEQPRRRRVVLPPSGNR